VGAGGQRKSPEAGGRHLQADELAIVNRNRRWSLRSDGNAVMILTLPPAG
jgi:hypothetical protein